MAKRQPVTDPELLRQLNAPSRRQPVTDPEILRQLNGSGDIPNVRTLKTKRAEDQTKALKTALKTRDPLIASRLVPSSDRSAGILPAGVNMQASVGQAPDLTVQQQRLAEYARMARATPEQSLAASQAAPIGQLPADPLADEQQAGNAIWQLQNRGGTYGPQNAPMGPIERAKDLYRSVDTGLGQGVAVVGGLPGLVQKNLPDIGAWIDRKLGRTPEEIEANRAKNEAYSKAGYQFPDIQRMTEGMDRQNPGSMSYRPATTAGRYGKAGGSFLAGGGMGGGFLRGVALPAVAGQFTEDVTGSPTAGAVASFTSPLALKAATSGLGRAISPFATTDAARLRNSNILTREGVRQTAGDITGSRMLRSAESQLGGNAYNRFREAQAEDITQAATGRIANATPSRRLDDTELNAMDSSIGREFTDLGRRNVSVPDRRFAHGLGDAWRNYAADTSATARIPRIQETILELAQMSRGGAHVPAARFQALRSEMAARSRTTTDVVQKRAYNSIRNAIDDMMERSIARTNPADLGRFRQVRRDWKNFLALEQAMSGASQSTNLGLVTPEMLAHGVRLKHGRTSIARNRSDFARLARASNALLRDIPNSGTAQNAAVRAAPHLAGAAAGGTIGALLTGDANSPFGFNPISTGLSAIGGAALPFLAGRALLSGPGRAALTNRLGLPLQRLGRNQGWLSPLFMAGMSYPAGLMSKPEQEPSRGGR